jgi:hypothetical protein
MRELNKAFNYFPTQSIIETCVLGIVTAVKGTRGCEVKPLLSSEGEGSCIPVEW